MARKRELELEVLRLQLQLERSTEDLARVRSERSDFAERANTLEWSLRAANDQAKDLQEQAQALAVKNAVLMERLELVAAGIGPEPTPAISGALPLPNGHEPEEVEDARYAYQAGRINTAEFNKLLENYGFSNAEVQIDGVGTPQF